MTAPRNGAGQYRAGSAFERRVMTELEQDGYQCLRAAGSKGAADVIALKPGQTLLVQVKLTNPPRGNASGHEGGEQRDHR